jgi:hypothetical protein
MAAYFLSPALVRLRLEVNALWPNRSKASDGWIGDTAHSARKSDHNPDYSAGGIVRAIDVTNDGINVDKFVSCVIRDVRTRYVITRGRIWTRENGWQKYTGSNGHYHHVHVSVRSTKIPRYDLQAHAWGLASTAANPIPTGGGSVAAPNIPGAPAPLEEDDMPTAAEVADEVLNRRVTLSDGNYLTVGQAIQATVRALEGSQLRTNVHDAVWVNPRWTVPGTDRKENPGQFLAATRVASVQSVAAAGKVIGLSDADIARLVAALPAPEPADPSAVVDEIADRLNQKD